MTATWLQEAIQEAEDYINLHRRLAEAADKNVFLVLTPKECRKLANPEAVARLRNEEEV